MAAVKACSVLITGANRGLGLEMVKQLSEVTCPKRQIFACCRDPDGPKSEKLRELAEKHHGIITIVRLDVGDPCSIKESAKKVSSLLGKNGLNLLVNNAAVLAHGTMQSTTDQEMRDAFNTNLMGPFTVTKEYLPYLRAAAKASDRSGMSCDKAAIINISAGLGSMTQMLSLYSHFPTFSYSVSKSGLNMLTVYTAIELKQDEILCVSIHPGWVKTDMGGDKAPLESRDSVADILQVMSSLTEKQHGGFLDNTGKTLPW
ncbi:C-factor-like [Triplophysa dalaica]|uniref:C-factor-like n=1 Tax=Triplophysa dalaica TaxID=1582913 RepID=UPI0024E013C7|nr:C-factor-like [Triplophysa dalaica]